MTQHGNGTVIGQYVICLTELFCCETYNDVDHHAKLNTPLTQNDKTQASNTVSQHHNSGLTEIINVSHFSNLTKLLRLTCIVLRFMNLLKHGLKQTKHTGDNTVPEVEPTKNMILQKTSPHTVVTNST